jgi:pimeloyl-ACP methyl ester carboxylesterase
MLTTETQAKQRDHSISLPAMSRRDWVWRGWQTRYTFMRPSQGQSNIPIILVHGFGASGLHWRHNMSELSQRHMVYALDLVGFGGSEKPPASYSISLWVEQIFEFWRTFVNQPAVIVGNSVGALISVIAAHAHPEMTVGVVAISLPDIDALEAMVPKPVRPIKRSLESIVLRLCLKPMFYFLARPKTIESVLKNFVYCDRSNVDPELVQIIVEPTLEKKAVTAFLHLSLSLNRPGYSPSLTRALQELQVPLLILWGAKDKAIPPTEGARLVKLAANARLIQLPDRGHCPHDEDPTRVNREILGWLDAITKQSKHQS